MMDNDTLLGNGLCFMARGNDVVRVFISTDKHINQNDIFHHLYTQITLDTAWTWFYLPWKDFGYSLSSMDRPLLTENVKITSLIFWPNRLKAQTSGLVEIKNLGYFYYDNESNDCDKDGISDTQDYDAGIDNVMFTMHAAPYNDFGNWNRLSNYYPPQQYIDWHSTSAHFGVRQTGPLTLGQVIDETYEEMLEIYPLKPVFLVEFAVHSDSMGIEDMSSIINNAFCHAIPSDYPMIKGWTYVNSDRYGTDYKSTSLELDEGRSNEFDQFVQCLEMNQDKYFENVQAYLVNSVQEEDNSLDNLEEDWVLKIYPNPANPRNRICIKYCLGGSQNEEFRKNDYRVNLNIYDLLGRRVYHRAITWDQGSLVWDADDKPSGVYIVRLEAGEATKQEKIVIIR